MSLRHKVPAWLNSGDAGGYSSLWPLLHHKVNTRYSNPNGVVLRHKVNTRCSSPNGVDGPITPQGQYKMFQSQWRRHSGTG